MGRLPQRRTQCRRLGEGGYTMPMNEAEPTEAFRRTYSSLLAEEAGVPIEIMKEALVVEGRDEAARPKAVSAAQLIWSSRENGKTMVADLNDVVMDSGTVAARIRETRQQEASQRSSPNRRNRPGSLNTMEMGEDPAGEDESFLDIRMVRSRYGTGAYGFYILVYGVAAFVVVLLMIMGVIITNGIHVMSKYMSETCMIEMSELHLSTLQKSCDDLNWLAGLNTAIIVVMSFAMGLVLLLLGATIYITRSQGIPYHKYMSKEL